jgi:glycosyltransferase involved in cell wall biosynthesis
MSQSTKPRLDTPAKARAPERQAVKVLVYSHFFAPSIGGAETIVMLLARGLAELRAADGAPEFELSLVTQIQRGSFDDAGLPFSVERHPGFFKLRRLIRNADIVHVAGPSFLPMLLAKLSRKPYVIEHHGYQAICPNGLLIHMQDRIVCPGHFQAGNFRECYQCQTKEFSRSRSFLNICLSLMRRALARRATANIAVTEHVLRRIGLPRMTVIQHGIAEPQQESPARETETHQERPVCFGFVGRMVPEKGASVFVSALAELRRSGKQFRAKLIGDGPEKPKIEAQIKKEGLQDLVQLEGSSSGRDFVTVTSQIDVMVMPSVWEETAGLAAMEQMMRGRMVIASDIGGLAEITADTALKFPVNDRNALVECMTRTIENPGLSAELGRLARQRALSNFNNDRMIKEHTVLYKSVLKTR